MFFGDQSYFFDGERKVNDIVSLYDNNVLISNLLSWILTKESCPQFGQLSRLLL